MARGWESKSVESQIADRPERFSAPEPGSPEAIAQAKKREGLELSRRRIVRELETARTETHRAALQNALAYLDAELAKLDH